MVDLTIYTVLGMNVLTFLAFGLDKWKAGRRGWRIPESTLLIMAWATGLLGAWLGMSLFRHKTRKTPFKIKMVLVTAANLLWLVLWLHLR